MESHRTGLCEAGYTQNPINTVRYESLPPRDGLPDPSRWGMMCQSNVFQVRRGNPEAEKTTVDENRFWSMIEAAWDTVGGKIKPRQRLAGAKLPVGRAYALQETLEEEVAPALRELLAELLEDELLAFDRILERKLYDIDRADIHERTDGSDDGFLYCRGFIVGMGKEYYEAVRVNPDLAVVDAECEEMCYLSWHLYHERFGEVPPSGISRETQSNSAGWASDVEPGATADGGV